MRILISTIILFAVLGSKVHACSCSAIPYEEAVENASEIFIGKVIKIELEKDLFPSGGDDFFPAIRRQFWVVTLEVSKKWKGSKKSRIQVKQTFNSCEYPFTFGGEYLVFAETSDLRWNGSRNHWTWLCSRTINTYYFNEWVNEYDSTDGWDFDDRELLDNQFPDGVRTASFFNNWFIWLTFFIASISLFLQYMRKRNAL
ncbi:MAG: hypothetical protein Wins2KO_32220 [Winogradskyella sp.]